MWNRRPGQGCATEHPDCMSTEHVSIELPAARVAVVISP